MASVQPFKAIRPTRDKANLVASRSYLSYSDETLTEKLDQYITSGFNIKFNK